jgi:hypothetical protein
MKRVVFILLFMMGAILCTNAQHLRFSEIPIEGSITSFQSKLAAKGIRVNQAESNKAPVGQRIFNGKFQGYNAVITVYYNRKTKDVYKVEAVIESKKKETIQGILDRSLKAIEQKYIYQTQHDLDDGTKLHFQYYILPTKESAEYIGLIHIKPSYAYYVQDNNSAGQNLQLASFIITFDYEDAVNTSKLTPSTTEPKSLRSFTCGTPDNYNKYMSWANNFRKNECYEKCIEYLTWILDYYKYGCVPQGMEEYEEVLDQAILSLQSRRIGRIKTAFSKEYANVYVVSYENTNQFKCIQFGVGSDMYEIKLNPNCITKQISALERLKVIYADKKTVVAGKKMNDYWRENINLTMPAIIGRDRLRGEFGDIEWKESNLTMCFSQYKQELRVEVNFDEFKPIFLFCSEQEIDDYLSFLKSVLSRIDR